MKWVRYAFTAAVAAMFFMLGTYGSSKTPAEVLETAVTDGLQKIIQK